jgi:hypothetical protein
MIILILLATLVSARFNCSGYSCTVADYNWADFSNPAYNGTASDAQAIIELSWEAAAGIPRYTDKEADIGGLSINSSNSNHARHTHAGTFNASCMRFKFGTIGSTGKWQGVLYGGSPTIYNSVDDCGGPNDILCYECAAVDFVNFSAKANADVWYDLCVYWNGSVTSFLLDNGTDTENVITSGCDRQNDDPFNTNVYAGSDAADLQVYIDYYTEFNYTVFGDRGILQKAVFSSNSTNASTTTYNGTDIQINLTITDTSGVDYYTLITNDTSDGSWLNQTIVDADGKSIISMIWNHTISNFSLSGGTFGWRVWTNDTLGYSTISDIYTFAVQGGNLDNCTLYTTYSVNFSMRDEMNESYVVSDVTGTFNYSTDQVVYNTFSLDMDSVNNFSICIDPSSATFYTDYNVQYSGANYPQRAYYENNGVFTSATVELPLYMLWVGDGTYGRFRVVDQYQTPLDDVTISMERAISGTERTIEQETTDTSGLATFWLNPDETYTFTFTKTGYGSETFGLRVTTSEIYTVTLTSESTDVNESIYLGWWYQFSPISTLLNNNTKYNFTFTLNSSYNDITNCTLKLFNGSNYLIQNSSSYTTTTCNIRIEYNAGNFSSILSEATFGINYTDIIVSQEYSVLYTYEGDFSLKNFLDDISDLGVAGFNDFTRMIIAFIVIFVIAALAAVRIGFVDSEKLIPLVVALVWFFSYVNWFYLDYTPIPAILGFDLKKYIIAIIVTLAGGAFLMDKFMR